MHEAITVGIEGRLREHRAVPFDPAPFVMLDRQDPSTRAGAELSTLLPGPYADTQADVALRLDLHGHYVGASGWGLYATMPFGYANAHSASGLGNGEIGAIWIPHLTNSTTQLVLHVGAVWPIAARDREALFLSSMARISDVALTFGGTSGVRFGISPLYRDGRFVFRADAGVDKLNSDTNGVPLYVHANAGFGLTLPRAVLMLESANYVAITGGGAYGRFFVDTAAISMRARGGTVSPYAALVFGIDDTSRADMRVALTVGVDAPL